MAKVFQNDEKSQKWLRDLLHTSEVSIIFTKKDGTDRKMLCTLMENVIPNDKKPKESEKIRKVSNESLAVFDVEKQDWRSFRWDSVKSIEFGV